MKHRHRRRRPRVAASLATRRADARAEVPGRDRRLGTQVLRRALQGAREVPATPRPSPACRPTARPIPRSSTRHRDGRDQARRQDHREVPGPPGLADRPRPRVRGRTHGERRRRLHHRRRARSGRRRADRHRVPRLRPDRRTRCCGSARRRSARRCGRAPARGRRRARSARSRSRWSRTRRRAVPTRRRSSRSTRRATS